MASSSEVGHAKNLANLKTLNNLITQLGAVYNPSNPQISLTSVGTLITQCQTDFDNWKAKLIIFKDVTDIREVAFDPIDKLVSLINASVQQLNEPQQTFNDVQALVSKIHGEAKKIKQKKEAQNAKQTSNTTTSTIDPGGLGTGTLDPGTGTGTGAGTLPVDPISTSQQSYDSILNNFDTLVKRLQAIPSYAPNETQLQITTLTAQVASLTTVNTNAANATNSLSLARNQRNLSFYAPQTGLYDIVQKIKKYLRSNPATATTAYHDATKLKFVKYVQRKKKKLKK